MCKLRARRWAVMRRGETDELDDRIVRLLQQDGRASNAQMAKELAVSEATIRNRISRLLADGWIQVMAVPSAKTLAPKLSAHLRVVAEPRSVAPVAERLAECREIRYVAISDRMEVLLEGYFRDQQQMYEFVTGQINPLPGVQRVSATVVMRLLKYTHDWDLSAQSRSELEEDQLRVGEVDASDQPGFGGSKRGRLDGTTKRRRSVR